MNIKLLQAMCHSPLHNYAGIPGLTSWLISNQGDKGTVRLFENERDHHEVIIPHSHRFDLQCYVIEGKVINQEWKRIPTPGHTTPFHYDEYMATNLVRREDGTFKRMDRERGFWWKEDKIFEAGDWYEMLSHEVHSIKFGRKTKVLFFEGPEESVTSKILEPIVQGVHIPTFKVEDWMYCSDLSLLA